MNIQTALSQFAALGATWVLWVLIALSISALAVIFDRALSFFSSRADMSKLRAHLEAFRETGSSNKLREALSGSRSLEAKVLLAAATARGTHEAEELLLAEQHVQRLQAEKRLAFLGTLGNNAPFVGLLGTVIGIIGAFGELDASGGQLTGALMAEIGEALIATAVGLLVALPAVGAYNYFQRVISVRLSQAEALSHVLLAYRRSKRAKPGVPLSSRKLGTPVVYPVRERGA